MKKTIGGFLLVVTAILLLLVTCDGPRLWRESGEKPVVSLEPTESVQPTTEDVTAEPTVETSAADSRRNDTPSRTSPVSPAIVAAANPSEAVAPAVAEAASSAENVKTERVLSTASLALLAPPAASSTEPAPDRGVEAMIAVSPRTLEGGTDPAVLLVSVDSLRNQLRIPLSADANWLPTDYTRGQPVSTINTPTAYGQQWGDLFAGVGYQNRIRYDDANDGIAAFGIGLGNPSRYVGLDVSVSILDTYTEIGQDRSLSLKLHRRLPYRTAIAVGHENLWHTDGTDGGSSRYVVVSKVMLFRDRPTSAFGSMVVNAGLGNDRFQSEPAFARGDDGINPFGSVGLRVLRPVNAVANWTGQDLALGLSIAPVRTWPLVITPAVMDVTGTAGDGARFAVSAGLSYNFRR
jgi:hypothetical protein